MTNSRKIDRLWSSSWSYVVLALCITIPLWVTSYPPLVDYPSHLARAFVGSALSTSHYFAASYQYGLSAIPNAALDLILPPAISLFGAYAAGKLFLTAIVCLTIMGLRQLTRHRSNPGLNLGLVCALLTINWMFLYGFINYLLGLGAFYLSLAWLLHRRADLSIRFALQVLAIAIALYLIHLSAVFFFLVAIFVIEGHRRRISTWILVVIPVTLALIGIVAIHLLPSLNGGFYWGTMLGKVAGLFAPFKSYSTGLDIAVIASLAIAIAVMLLASFRSITINRPLMLIATILFALYFITPFEYAGVGGIDRRAIPAAWTCLLMSMNFSERSRRVHIAYGVACTVLIVRFAMIAVEWQSLSDKIERQVTALQVLPAGAKVYPLIYEDYLVSHPMERPFAHTLSYAVIERSVIDGDFWNNIIHETQPLPKPKLYSDKPLHQVEWDTLNKTYDYYWTYHLDPALNGYLATISDTVTTIDGFTLLKLRH